MKQLITKIACILLAMMMIPLVALSEEAGAGSYTLEA